MKKSVEKFAGGKRKKVEQALGLSLRNLFEQLAWRTCQLRCVHKKRGIGACKYASKRLKASCASYTQRARSACFVPVMQKMQINREIFR